MILGFKEQFKEPILNGTKIHTIREDKKDRFRTGSNLQLATGVRTKQYDCFKETVCTGIQKIRIVYENIMPMGETLSVCIDGRCIDSEELKILAKKDGFKKASDLLDFLMGDEDVFIGKIIHWTDFKY